MASKTPVDPAPGDPAPVDPASDDPASDADPPVLGVAQLVLYDLGGIAGAYVDDMEHARSYARAAGGVVVELPIVADYREAGPHGT